MSTIDLTVLECTNSLIEELTKTQKNTIKQMGLGAVGGAVGGAVTGAMIGTTIGGPFGIPIGVSVGIARGAISGAVASWTEDKIRRTMIERGRKQARLARKESMKKGYKQNPKELGDKEKRK
ncbi:MAG: hypothetical protein H8D97_01040 [Proteobacteria bacterium]|nr:hypothetical protein [Pseudomonadota bacterium]